MLKLNIILLCTLTVYSVSISFVSAKKFDINVYKAQIKLKKKGYNPGPIDGLLGKKTEKAIRQFQQKNGLSLTGELDVVTKESLSGVKILKQTRMPSEIHSKILVQTGHSDPIFNKLSFSNNGKHIVTGGSCSLKVYKIMTGLEIKTIKGEVSTISSNGKYAIVDNKIIDIFSNQIINYSMENNNWNSSFSPCGSYIVNFDQDNIYLMDIFSRQVKQFYKVGNGSDYVQCGVNGKYILLGNYGNEQKSYLWMTSSNTLKTFSPSRKSVFSRDGKWFLLFTGKELIIYDLPQFNKYKIVKFSALHDEHLYSLAISPNGKYFAIGTCHAKRFEQISGRVIIWNRNTGKIFRTFSKESSAISFSSDARYIASYSPERKYLRSDSDTIYIWNINTGNLVQTIKHRLGHIKSIALSSNQKYLLALHNRYIFFWDLINGTKICSKEFECYHCYEDISFSSNDKIGILKTFKDLGASGYPHVLIWEICTNSLIDESWRESSYTKEDEEVNSKTILQKGNIKISITEEDGIIYLWSKVSGELLLQLIGYQDGEWVVVSPKGYYNCSPRAEKNLLIKDSDKIYRISKKSKKQFFRPDIIKRILDHNTFFGSKKTNTHAGDSDISHNLSQQEFSPKSNKFQSYKYESKSKKNNEYLWNENRNIKYYALIVGINSYKYLNRLKTAVNDSHAIERILRKQYGFRTTLLLNKEATRNNILKHLYEYNSKLDTHDHLLIYYAGHGYYDKIENQSYWLPADSEMNNRSNWILSDRLSGIFKIMKPTHILLISDSCYSGTLTRSIKMVPNIIDRALYINKLFKKKARILISSGGNELVADTGVTTNHSFFADSLIYGLQSYKNKVFTAQELFIHSIKEKVAGRTFQIPEYRIIRNSGHNGGDFIFVKK